MKTTLRCVGLVAMAAILLSFASPLQRQEKRSDKPAGGGADGQPSEVEALVEKVLANRKINWEAARNYVFHELESLQIKGQEIADLQGFQREYLWIVRDDYLIRSPLKANGAPVSEAVKKKEEEKWFHRKRDGRRLEREIFFDFDFKQGELLFAGYQQFEGRKLAVIEFYPRHFFSREAYGDEERRYTEMLDKTTLVRLLVEPQEHQMVRMTFENVGLEFLPYRWLVRVDDLSASITMAKPIENVWLPRDIEASGKISTASFQLEIVYLRKFSQYQKTDVKVKLRYDKKP
ncbi:MAG: hypothetical protein V3T83_00635 [Acidobacteriota bacterium]